MRLSSWARGLIVAGVVGLVGCGEPKKAPPTAEQQKSIDDEMQKTLQKTKKK